MAPPSAVSVSVPVPTLDVPSDNPPELVIATMLAPVFVILTSPFKLLLVSVSVIALAALIVRSLLAIGAPAV